LLATNQFDVVRELATMHDRMNRIWGSVTDHRHDDVTSRGSWMPPVDVSETEGREVVMKVEVPGLRREDIDVTVEDNTLTIKGERRRDDAAFSRSFTLPNTLDGTKIRAEYRDGVLTIVLPVREEARPRQIQVEVKN
jgi:HSP20 family protein